MTESAGGGGAAEDATVKVESKNPEFDAQMKDRDHQALKDNLKNAGETVKLKKQQLKDAEKAEADAKKELEAFPKGDD